MGREVYRLTDEHRAKLAGWAQRWIRNALRTGPYTETELRRTRRAMRGIYRAAKLEPPPAHREIFAAGPISGAIAACVASGVWWLREHPEKHAELFGRQVEGPQLMASIGPACAFVVAHGMGALTGAPVEPPALLPAATSAATDAATSAATRAATSAATDAATDAATSAATHAATSAATSAATYAATRAATYAATSAATDAATYAATHAATSAATDAATSAATRAATRAVVRFLVLCCVHWTRMYQGGNQWSGWAAYLSFFRRVAKLPIDYSAWRHYEAASLAGRRFVHSRFWIVTARPEAIRQDDRDLPHCATGPFCRWPDGFAVWYWHGLAVPRAWIEQPSTVDPQLALTWANVEQRRALAEILGWGRVLEQLRPRVLDEDANPMIGTLLEADLPDAPREKFLRVRCGTGRDFVLLAPSEATTAAEAQSLMSQLPVDVITGGRWVRT